MGLAMTVSKYDFITNEKRRYSHKGRQTTSLKNDALRTKHHSSSSSSSKTHGLDSSKQNNGTKVATKGPTEREILTAQVSREYMALPLLSSKRKIHHLKEEGTKEFPTSREDALKDLRKSIKSQVNSWLIFVPGNLGSTAYQVG